MIEFNGERVGMLCFAIQISLEGFQISTPFLGWVLCQNILMLLKHPKDSMNKHRYNTVILNSKFEDVFIVARTAPLTPI